MQQDYAKAFRIVRAAFGLQQAELAARMPITASQLSLIEAGKRQPSVRAINALASAVGIPTALVSLLASSVNEIETKADADLASLARTLLRLLVSANDTPQESMKFSP